MPGREKQQETNDMQFATPTMSEPLEKGQHGTFKRRRLNPKHTMTKRVTRPRPPRPVQPLTFALPKHLLASPSPSTPTGKLSPMPLSKTKDERPRSLTPTHQQSNSRTESSLVRLARINVLVSGIHRRNKNQHRNQPFYKHFSILRRCVSKLINLHDASAALAEPAAIKSSTRRPTATAALARERFEKESQLRSKREGLEEHLREITVPASYVAFSTLVADTQFANLGVVLLGVLADVVGVVGPVRKVEEEKRLGTSKSTTKSTTERTGAVGGRLVGLSTMITGPDQGKVVERVYDSDHGILSEMEVDDKVRSLGGRNINESGIDMGEVIQRGQPDVLSRVANDRGREQNSKLLETPHEDDNLNEDSSIVAQVEEAKTTPSKPTTDIEILVSDNKDYTEKLTSSSPVTTERDHRSTPSIPTKPPSNLTITTTAATPTDDSHLPSNPHVSANRPSTTNPNPNPSNSSTSNLAITPTTHSNKPNTNSTNPPNPKAKANADRDTGAETKRPTKKDKARAKKKRNAIDDLFSGFG